MELNQMGVLEELFLAQKGENSWTTTFHGEMMMDQIIPNSHFTFDQDLSSNSSLLGLLSSTESRYMGFPCYESFGYVQDSLCQEMGSAQMNDEYDFGPLQIQQEGFEGIREDFGVENNRVEECKVGFEEMCESVDGDGDGDGDGGERKSKMKKVGAHPSKNLMAERRRRKRLNDRLSMLRSIVPKISKMDRTAILGDTIDYMKELLDKIRKLREDHDIENNTNQNSMILGSSCSELILPNESLVRNTPKFDVERRNEDTRVELCCAAKPGMLLSTLGTLEALGLDVQQCVISCFNDFSLQASCSEVAAHGGIFSSEDIKQALFRNAGYGGRCL